MAAVRFIAALCPRRGRSQCAHAHSVGKAIENGELCRAALRRSRTRPLGTTAGVQEDSPGGPRERQPADTANSDSFRGPKQRRARAVDDSAPHPPVPPVPPPPPPSLRAAAPLCRETPTPRQCRCHTSRILSRSFEASVGRETRRRLVHHGCAARRQQLLRGDAVPAAAAVDVVRREGGGAAVQRGGKKRLPLLT